MHAYCPFTVYQVYIYTYIYIYCIYTWNCNSLKAREMPKQDLSGKNRGKAHDGKRIKYRGDRASECTAQQESPRGQLKDSEKTCVEGRFGLGFLEMDPERSGLGTDARQRKYRILKWVRECFPGTGFRKGEEEGMRRGATQRCDSILNKSNLLGEKN